MKENKKQNLDGSIIAIKEIQAILSNYHIGKKPLAKLLGWGETTIIRYIEGDIPTIEYSEKLRMILNNPIYYYNILIKNKDNITGVAFRKSKKAVTNLLMKSKLNVVAQYIINYNHTEITSSYIQTLLYYVQSFSLALEGIPIFEEDCAVNERNIPFLKLYDYMKKFGISRIDLNEEALSQTEKELIHSVMDAFLWYGPKMTYAMVSHEKALLKVSRDKDNNKIIAKDTLKAYFQDIVEKYDIRQIDDICKYPDKRIADIKDL